jgi:rhamnulokinase
MAKKYLAFDFGASSGRAMLGTLADGKLSLRELHRFSNDPVTMNGRFIWDLPRLYYEIIAALKKAAGEGIDAIGIDTWGVDYGLLDANGRLIGNPTNYRDTRTDGMMDEAFKTVPKQEIYEATGLAFLQFNTLYQLFASAKADDSELKTAKDLLFMPDLMAYLLTGEKGTEYTIASTSQMIDPATRSWAVPMLEKLGLPTQLLGQISDPGTVRGYLSKQIQEETGLGPVPVIAVAGHDTASAVAAVPASDAHFAYISSGTWSLVGGETHAPVISPEAQAANFTNEGGVFGTIRVLKNVMGLWIIQECKRHWDSHGQVYSFPELVELAQQAPALKSLFDPDDEGFLKPYNMPDRLCAYMEKHGQPVPQSIGAITRAIYESLALKYRWCIEKYEAFTGQKVDALHIVGGGSNNALLNQFTADALGIPVIAGPSEATAIGNLMMQAVAMGDVADLWALRAVVRDSFPPAVVRPQGGKEAWDEAYARFTSTYSLK